MKQINKLADQLLRYGETPKEEILLFVEKHNNDNFYNVINEMSNTPDMVFKTEGVAYMFIMK